MSKSTVIFIAAIICIPAAVFSVAYYFSVSLKSDISTLISAIESIENAMPEDNETEKGEVSEFVNTFSKEWKKRSEIWCLFFNHESIHQIDFMRAELEAEISTGEYDAALITSERIKCAFEMMSQHDALNVSNFFDFIKPYCY